MKWTVFFLVLALAIPGWSISRQKNDLKSLVTTNYEQHQLAESKVLNRARGADEDTVLADVRKINNSRVVLVEVDGADDQILRLSKKAKPRRGLIFNGSDAKRAY
jgi:hypothetical protein